MGASVGPDTSNGDGKHGSQSGLCATCRPDPLIATGLAALAPSSWELDIAANSTPSPPFVMVANVSRQSGSWKPCGSSVRHDGTRQHRGGQAVCLENLPCLGQDTARWRVSPPGNDVNQTQLRESNGLGTTSTPNTRVPSTACLAPCSSVLSRLVHGTIRQSDHRLPRGLNNKEFSKPSGMSQPQPHSNLGERSVSQHGQGLEPRTFLSSGPQEGLELTGPEHFCEELCPEQA